MAAQCGKMEVKEVVSKKIRVFVLIVCLVLSVADSSFAASFSPEASAHRSSRSEPATQTSDLPALPFPEETEAASERIIDVREQPLDEEFYLYRNTLSTADKALYDEIYEDLATGSTRIRLTNSDGDWQHITSIIFDVIRDHPELFWLYTQCSYEYDYDTRVFRADVYSYDLVEDLDTARRQFRQSVDPVISFASTFESDVERAKAVHDWLIQAVTYSWDGYHQSPYGAFVDRTAVCTGYVRAFQYCLQRLGIRAAHIGNWDHAWNLVELGSAYYVVDVTSDDPDSGLIKPESEDAEPAYYACFNITDAQMERFGNERDAWSERLPEALGTEYSVTDHFNGEARLTDCSHIDDAMAALPAPPGSGCASVFSLTTVVQAVQDAHSIQGGSMLQEAQNDADTADTKESEVLAAIAAAASLRQDATQPTAPTVAAVDPDQSAIPALAAQPTPSPEIASDSAGPDTLPAPVAQSTPMPAAEPTPHATPSDPSLMPTSEPTPAFAANVVTVSNRRTGRAEG